MQKNNTRLFLKSFECRNAISDRYTNICPDGHDSLLRTMKTCSFKELEASPTCLRAKEKSGKILLNITGGGYKRLKEDYKIKQDRGADGDKIVGAIGARCG